MNVFCVLNSHSHVMYILSILLAKYSEVKVSLKPRKTTAYKCETFDDQGLDITRFESTAYYDKIINQCDLNSDKDILSVTYIE